MSEAAISEIVEIEEKPQFAFEEDAAAGAENTDDVATEPEVTEPEPEPAPEQTEEEKQAIRKKTAQERINEVTRKYREEERRRLALEAEINTLKAKTAIAEPLEEPTPDNFASYDDYDRAHKKWIAKSVFREEQEAIQQRNTIEQNQRIINEMLDKHAERESSVKDKYVDYDEIVGATLFTETERFAIFNADNGPEVAYYLGTHPQESARLKLLPPYGAIMEIGKISARLAMETAPKIRQSQAPKPIKPVRANDTVNVDVFDPNLSTEERIALWQR